MGIQNRTAAAISGLVFAGTAAIAVGLASPVGAATPATVQVMTAAPHPGTIGQPEPRCRWVCDTPRRRQDQAQVQRQRQRGAGEQEQVQAQRQLERRLAEQAQAQVQRQRQRGGGEQEQEQEQRQVGIG